MRSRDIAAAGVIDHSVRAHRFVRLYFRPRTPTQYHIEGIRKSTDLQYGSNAHAPVLVMFVFDARKILMLDDVQFSAENMQTGIVEQGSEENFRSIPFAKVYHEGGTGGDRSIIAHRCAEVLAPSPLVLSDMLQWIYCRSEAERASLIHALGNTAPVWDKRIRVSDDIKVFEKRFCFVEAVSLANDGIIFRLNPRHDMLQNYISIKSYNSSGKMVCDFTTENISAYPPKSKFWRFDVPLSEDEYRVIIDIEGHRAYNALLKLDQAPF